MLIKPINILIKPIDLSESINVKNGAENNRTKKTQNNINNERYYGNEHYLINALDAFLDYFFVNLLPRSKKNTEMYIIHAVTHNI